ncbi:MAG TPA: PAS domain S-box protein [Syntrophales bacterium]|nr:PAS domain S-box protein [Syntrophales bacterium]
MLELILFISVLLQVVAAILALRLIRITEVRAAWILIAASLALMSVRRVIDVLPLLHFEVTRNINLLDDMIGVAISVLMVVGVALIAPVFFALRQSGNDLRESEERYRLLIETMNEGLGMVDNKGIRTFVNRKFCELTGYSEEELIGYPATKLYAEEESQKIFLEQRLKREKGEDEPYEIIITHKDGNRIQVLVSPKPVYDKDGRYVGSIATFTDITARKKAEERLKESEQRLQTVLQGSPLPTIVIGRDHRIIYWNRALEELSGMKAGDIVGTKEQWRAFYSEERPCLADLIVDQALDQIPKWYLDKYVKSRLLEEAYEATDFFPELGDAGKWLRFTAAVIRDANGNLVGAIETLEDITDRKRAEEELIRVEKLESLGIFAGGIAHDFNNLLSVMLRNIFAAKLSLPDEHQESLGEGLDVAEKAGHQAKELAHRLITFAKGGEPVRKIGSISELLTDAVELSISGSHIKCEFTLPDDLWPVEMDDIQIRQVIHNVVVNAREAMGEKGTITIAAGNVSIAASDGLPLKDGKYVKWSVRDQGSGIPEEDMQKIFDPYFTTKPTGTARGMGLGLAICYSIVKKHGGFMTVESERGVGSTFIVYLPATSRDDTRRGSAAAETILTKGRVLVMDDEESIRNATGIVLNYLGYDVEYATNGGEAVDLYRRSIEKGHPFYAVILDLNVPGGMGGKEALQKLQEIDPRVRAIISCGYVDDPAIAKLSEEGACRSLDVPYDIEKIREILESLS